MSLPLEGIVAAVRSELEVKGVLARLRAELRLAVVTAIDEKERQRGIHGAHPGWQALHGDRDARLVLGLIAEALAVYKLTSTRACLLAESGMSEADIPDMADIHTSLPNVFEGATGAPQPPQTPQRPALTAVVEHARNSTTGGGGSASALSSGPTIDTSARPHHSHGHGHHHHHRHDHDAAGSIGRVAALPPASAAATGAAAGGGGSSWPSPAAAPVSSATGGPHASSDAAAAAAPSGGGPTHHDAAAAAGMMMFPDSEAGDTPRELNAVIRGAGGAAAMSAALAGALVASPGSSPPQFRHSTASILDRSTPDFRTPSVPLSPPPLHQHVFAAAASSMGGGSAAGLGGAASAAALAAASPPVPSGSPPPLPPQYAQHHQQLQQQLQQHPGGGGGGAAGPQLVPFAPFSVASGAGGVSLHPVPSPPAGGALLSASAVTAPPSPPNVGVSSHEAALPAVLSTSSPSRTHAAPTSSSSPASSGPASSTSSASSSSSSSPGYSATTFLTAPEGVPPSPPQLHNQQQQGSDSQPPHPAAAAPSSSDVVLAESMLSPASPLASGWGNSARQASSSAGAGGARPATDAASDAPVRHDTSRMSQSHASYVSDSFEDDSVSASAGAGVHEQLQQHHAPAESDEATGHGNSTSATSSSLSASAFGGGQALESSSAAVQSGSAGHGFGFLPEHYRHHGHDAAGTAAADAHGVGGGDYDDAIGHDIGDDDGSSVGLPAAVLRAAAAAAAAGNPADGARFSISRSLGLTAGSDATTSSSAGGSSSSAALGRSKTLGLGSDLARLAREMAMEAQQQAAEEDTHVQDGAAASDSMDGYRYGTGVRQYPSQQFPLVHMPHLQQPAASADEEGEQEADVHHGGSDVGLHDGAHAHYDHEEAGTHVHGGPHTHLHDVDGEARYMTQHTHDSHDHEHWHEGDDGAPDAEAGSEMSVAADGTDPAGGADVDAPAGPISPRASSDSAAADAVAHADGDHDAGGATDTLPLPPVASVLAYLPGGGQQHGSGSDRADDSAEFLDEDSPQDIRATRHALKMAAAEVAQAAARESIRGFVSPGAAAGGAGSGSSHALSTDVAPASAGTTSVYHSLPPMRLPTPASVSSSPPASASPPSSPEPSRRDRAFAAVASPSLPASSGESSPMVGLTSTADGVLAADGANHGAPALPAVGEAHDDDAGAIASPERQDRELPAAEAVPAPAGAAAAQLSAIQVPHAAAVDNSVAVEDVAQQLDDNVEEEEAYESDFDEVGASQQSLSRSAHTTPSKRAGAGRSPRSPAALPLSAGGATTVGAARVATGAGAMPLPATASRVGPTVGAPVSAGLNVDAILGDTDLTDEGSDHDDGAGGSSLRDRAWKASPPRTGSSSSGKVAMAATAAAPAVYQVAFTVPDVVSATARSDDDAADADDSGGLHDDAAASGGVGAPATAPPAPATAAASGGGDADEVEEDDDLRDVEQDWF